MYNKLLGGLLGKLRAMNPVCARLQSISILYWKPKAKQGPLWVTKATVSDKAKVRAKEQGHRCKANLLLNSDGEHSLSECMCAYTETGKRNWGKWKRQQSPGIKPRTHSLCSQCSATEVRQPNSQLPLRVHIHVCIHVHTHTRSWHADLLYSPGTKEKYILPLKPLNTGAVSLTS